MTVKEGRSLAAMADDVSVDIYKLAPTDAVARPWLAKEHALRRATAVARDRWTRSRLPVVDVLDDGDPIQGGSADQPDKLGRLHHKMDETDADWRQHIDDWHAAGMAD